MGPGIVPYSFPPTITHYPSKFPPTVTNYSPTGTSTVTPRYGTSVIAPSMLSYAAERKEIPTLNNNSSSK